LIFSFPSRSSPVLPPNLSSVQIILYILQTTLSSHCSFVYNNTLVSINKAVLSLIYQLSNVTMVLPNIVNITKLKKLKNKPLYNSLNKSGTIDLLLIKKLLYK
jgi:hypothetical protein